jgi:protein gp37
MGDSSHIEWTDATWNPVTGCSKVSPGCKHCYAERMASRLKAMGQPNYTRGFRTTTHERMLEIPLRWKQPRRIFVNSMSDIFHSDVPNDFIRRIFEIMNTAPWHQYQVLTKRSERLSELAPFLPWRPNIWMGVSVESDDYKYRIDHLRQTPAHIKFLSLEPLLGPFADLNLEGIDWVIVGGESGPGARQMESGWVRGIRSRCANSNVPFFFKQWGGVAKRRAGRILDGRTWDEMPEKNSGGR